MRFMILVRSTGPREAGRTPAAALLDPALAAYRDELSRAGVLLDAAGLQPGSRSWKIEQRGGLRQVVDATDAAEGLAGYALIQVRSREEALEWTRRFPMPAGEGVEAVVEVRQLLEPERAPAPGALSRSTLRSAH